MIATTIVDLVFSNEKIVIGERAESVLTYGKPASKILRKLGLSNLSFGIDKDYDIFQQAALPIGNGDMGLSILGETNKEKLIFNEKTLWSGGTKKRRERLQRRQLHRRRSRWSYRERALLCCQKRTFKWR